MTNTGTLPAPISRSLFAALFVLAGVFAGASAQAQEDASHLPAITAAEVVDRATLKAFVTEAGKFFVALIEEADDPAAISKARIAARDPNGPWRHGPVYLYVFWNVPATSPFRGAFPDVFEYRPLIGIARDGVTGELVLPQIIAAAESGPEGGFLEYHFDDPADDTDSVDIPKVGYARAFTTKVGRVDGTVFTLNLIVGSGFYRSPSQVESAD